MANSKVSDLDAITSPAGGNTLYAIEDGTSKKLTLGTMFGAIASQAVFNSQIRIEDLDTITSAGTIATNTNVTLITNPDGAGNCSIGDGASGQIKIIIMSSNTGGHTITLQGSNVANDISFDALGETSFLIWISSAGKWFHIGGTATVS